MRDDVLVLSLVCQSDSWWSAVEPQLADLYPSLLRAYSAACDLVSTLPVDDASVDPKVAACVLQDQQRGTVLIFTRTLEHDDLTSRTALERQVAAGAVRFMFDVLEDLSRPLSSPQINALVWMDRAAQFGLQAQIIEAGAARVLPAIMDRAHLDCAFLASSSCVAAVLAIFRDAADTASSADRRRIVAAALDLYDRREAPTAALRQRKGFESFEKNILMIADLFAGVSSDPAFAGRVATIRAARMAAADVQATRFASQATAAIGRLEKLQLSSPPPAPPTQSRPSLRVPLPPHREAAKRAAAAVTSIELPLPDEIDF
jgi:hypothetical protein